MRLLRREFSLAALLSLFSATSDAQPIGAAFGPTRGIGAATVPSYNPSNITLTQITNNIVFQRAAKTGGSLSLGTATITVQVSLALAASLLEFQLVDSSNNTIVHQAWTTLGTSLATGSHTFTPAMPASIYQYNIQLRGNGGAPLTGTTQFSIGEVVACYGQSLCVDWFVDFNNGGGSLAGLTPPLVASGRGFCYAFTNPAISVAGGLPGGPVSAGPVTGASWQLPGDNTIYPGAGCVEFTNRLSAAANVAAACIGLPVNAQSIAQLSSGTGNYTAFTALLNAAGTGFDTFLWYQGHTDSQLGTTQAAYQTALASLITGLQGTYGSFNTVIVGIPALLSNTEGTAAQVDAIRTAQQVYAAANPSTTLWSGAMDCDMSTNTIHPSPAGQRTIADHVFRMTSNIMALSGATGDVGPSVTAGVIRGSGSTSAVMTVAQNLGTALSGVGSLIDQAAQFLVTTSGAGPAGSPFTLDATTPITLAPASITFTLASVPLDSVSLGVYYRPAPDGGGNTALGEAIALAGVYDNYTTDIASGSPALGGRQLFPFWGEITIPAPAEFIAPGIPTNVGFGTSGLNNLPVTWQLPATGGMVVTYALRFTTDATLAAWTGTGGSTGITGIAATTYNLTSLAGSTAYYVEINATNASGTSAWTTAVSATTGTGTGGNLPVVTTSGGGGAGTPSLIAHFDFSNPSSLYSDAARTTLAGTTTGSVVRGVKDLSGNVNDVSQTISGGQSPTVLTSAQNGLSALTYTASASQFLQSLSGATWMDALRTGGCTILAIVKHNTLATSSISQCYVSASANVTNGPFQWALFNTGFTSFVGATAVAEGYTSSASYLTLFNGSVVTSTLYKNIARVNPTAQTVGALANEAGIVPGITDPTFATGYAWDTFDIGASVSLATSAGSFMDGVICEVVVWGGTLDDASVTAIENYASGKWAGP